MIDLSFFRGARPKPEPHLLEVGEAVLAHNCRLQGGGLEPFRGLSLVQATSLPGVQTIHRFGVTNFWFEFADVVSVAEGPLPSDTETTTYFTGDGEPAMTYAGLATGGAAPYPSNKWRLGVPAPSSPMTVATSGTPDPDDDIPESRVYTVTWVTARGEEGPPAPASSVIDVLSGESVELTNIPTVPTGNYNVATKRIYRSATASGDTEYLFVAEIPAAQTSYTDSLAGENLGEVLPSVDWYQPPDDMQGLIALENGVMAGFSGKELCLSEAYLPHAWPPGYRVTLDQPIVGIVGVRGGVVAATTGQPYVVSFTSPAAAVPDKVQSPRACVSARSMVDMGDYAVYATADGLVAVDGTGAAPLITAEVIDTYDWARFNPETIHAYRLHDWYVGFYQGADGDGGFAITARGDAFVTFDVYADAGYSDPNDGNLYLVINDEIVAWDGDIAAPLTYLWHSGDYLVPQPKNMAAARVDADSYPATPDASLVFRLYADGAQVFEQQVTSQQPFWLPAGTLSRRFAVELSGTRTVRRVLVAESVEELT